MDSTATTDSAAATIAAPAVAPKTIEVELPEPLYDVAICGAGPSGMTAAIYAQRAGLSAVLVEGNYPGGQLNLATEIENFPGFSEPVPGIDLSLRMEEQVRRLGAEIVSRKVAGLSRDPAIPASGSHPDWRVSLSDGTFLRARTVIVATGASPRTLGLPREAALMGNGVSYCATCDGGFFKGREVAVVGGGSTAVEDAIYLSRMCRKVTVIHRRDALRAERVLQERLFAIPNVTVLWDTVIAAFQGDSTLSGLELLNRKTGEKSVLPVAALFVAVGQDPGSAAFSSLLDLDESGYVVTDDSMRTCQPGVFAAGDVRVSGLRQIVTALSDGARAATEAARYLNMDPNPPRP